MKSKHKMYLKHTPYYHQTYTLLSSKLNQEFTQHTANHWLLGLQ